MAPKRFKKILMLENNKDKYKNLILSDVLCPICRNILIEPVTLPCNHGFCLTCFNGTVENAALSCPLCRTRIGSWLRLAKKEKRIVNNILWETIQSKFSNEIKKKLNGDDITVEEEIKIKIADPGEIRREYELQMERERSEIKKQRDTEAKASEFIIKKIIEEEQEAAKLEEEKLRLDEEIARRLAKEEQSKSVKNSQKQNNTNKLNNKSSINRYMITLNKSKNTAEKSKNNNEVPAPSVDHTTGKKTHITTIMCQKRPKPQCSKPLQNLFLTKTQKCDRAESNGSDSGDSIKQEMRYFKPIRLAPSMDKCQDGQIVQTPIKLPALHPSRNPSPIIRSPQTTMKTQISSHPRSAFVSLSPINQSSIFVPPIKQPSITNESGKVIKQYYNKKRNTFYTAIEQIKKQRSPFTSPLLGFEEIDHQNSVKNVVVLNGLINQISEFENVKKSDEKFIITNNISKSVVITPPKKINGFIMNNTNNLKSIDITLQEKLDLEFAKRLHEELNNPRQTRASSKPVKQNAMPRSRRRKRQVTLDELITTPKKFKL